MTGLSEEQMDWLSTLAYYSSIALENMVKVEDLLLELRKTKSDSNSNWINRLIFSWSEEERKKLAGDIHDTFLQDIIILKRKIETLNEKVGCQLTNRLVDLDEDIEDIIFNIRETCHELTPPLLSELGLQAALDDLTMKFHLRSNVHLNVKLDKNFDEYCLTIDYKRVIYRTIQELLNNAIKHSQSTKVDISLKIKGRHILLNYEDNGIGIDTVSTNESENSMGLLGIKERVRSFGGSIDFISSPGEGLVVISDIPIV
ncbi:MAG: sensor histidine kinase [Bacillaceae bacterium]|nr:sensor histidine kinase [Bacillaceae bacterium]